MGGISEISTTGILFNANIRLYTLKDNQYILYNKFTQEYNENKVIDNINLLFDNNKQLDFNEFTILITKSNKNKADLIKILKINI